MRMKDELKKVFNPGLVDRVAAKLEELGTSDTAKKLNAVVKNTAARLSDKLDELAERPYEKRDIHKSQDGNDKEERGVSRQGDN